MDTHRPKLQFTLRDLIEISLLCGIGIFALSPGMAAFMAELSENSDEPTTALQSFCCGLIIATTCLGGWIGIRRAMRRQYSMVRQGVSILACVLLSWFPFILVGVPESRVRVHLIERNERKAIVACKAFAEAEEVYHRTLHKNSAVLEYAPTVADLYETAPGKADVRLVDARMMQAEAAGQAKPRAGYVFKVLTAQSSYATGGKKSYIATGSDGKVHMVSGYALIASPARYGIDGCNTFIFNHCGTIFQHDLGPDTSKIFESTQEFDPSEIWRIE